MKWKLKINVLAAAAILLIGCTACNSPQNQSKQPSNNGESTTKKTDNGITAFPGAKKQVTDFHGNKVTWLVCNNAGWSKNFYGLKIGIEQIALTKRIPNIQLGKKTPAIRIKFKMHNTSGKKFEYHPVRATLITSTGKSIKAAMFISNKFNGEIGPGESKEASVGFYFTRDTNISQIKWIRLRMSGKRISSQALKKVKEKGIDTGKIMLK